MLSAVLFAQDADLPFYTVLQEAFLLALGLYPTHDVWGRILRSALEV